MVKFLHIADIHLGTNQYNSPEETRKRDFFYTFNDVINRYAIDEKIDFVIVAGDLFDKVRIDPATLNQAILVFQQLKDSNIPAYVIEGNHDSQAGRDTISWLQFLGEHGYITFLKPDYIDDKLSFSPCSKDKKYCGYVEFNNQIRIIGTQWFGANTAHMIEDIARAVEELGDYPFTLLILHAGLEGYLAGYGTISKATLEPLKPLVNYLALGHIHLYYVYDGWVYNPGSLEALSFPEFFDPHGALLVEIDKKNNIHYTLIDDYTKREFIRIAADISGCPTPDQATQTIKKEITTTRKYFDGKPLVELIIDGALEFRRSDLNLDELRTFAKDYTDALLVNLKYYARPKEYAIGANLSISSTRDQIEYTVIKDMLSQFNSYNEEQDKFARTVIDLKNMVLENEPCDKIYQYLNKALPETEKTNEDS
jgi:DNA repair exonuclease SbcCD nuclease subunit